MTEIRSTLLTVFGLGRFPRAPGTIGSLPVAIAFVLLMLFASEWVTNIVLLLLLAAASIVTIALGAWATEHWGRSDAEEIVSDEVAGQALTFLCLPWGMQRIDDNPIMIIGIGIVGFVLFRIFDILKPPPINGLQSLRDGWGVLMDDLVAGLFAGGLLWLLVWQLA
ncbi:MAG: phosphatidylglycerophosphatase [Phycisphaerae bacterium]|nr:phosphatidylglycerophosphatase [Phycisphaerae bacterium]|tara:strand:- start:3734 stop:4231 length:498 start_codon:yes stop_codon:yes gene_type:complete